MFFTEQPYLDRLRPGFSAVVTVHTGNAGGRLDGHQ
jgi:membrane fusion protein, multidrug efflux system